MLSLEVLLFVISGKVPVVVSTMHIIVSLVPSFNTGLSWATPRVSL